VKKEKIEEEEEESEFKKETDPSKIGKALSDSINKKTIIGVLFMLMILPILS
jgi:preprotein translocase subunit SecF